MTEPELEGRGVSSASRRRFLWLGGIAAGLLLVPNSSLAAKVANAVKRSSGSSSGKSAKSTATKGKSATSRTSSPAKRPSTVKGKSTAKASAKPKAVVKKSVPARTAAQRKAPARTTRTVAHSGGARREIVRVPSRLESPEPFAPGRAFSFGGAGSSQVRSLSLYNIHTGESLSAEYYVNGRYEPEALRAFDNLLRDYHTDEVCQFDPRVLNQLFELRNALGSREAFHVCSGYRSPTTNENYRRAGARVAEHSFHMTGQAIDVFLPGRDLRQLRNVAVAMRAGGVGYYPGDGFVHLDSGPVRRW